LSLVSELYILYWTLCNFRKRIVNEKHKKKLTNETGDICLEEYPLSPSDTDGDGDLERGGVGCKKADVT